MTQDLQAVPESEAAGSTSGLAWLLSGTAASVLGDGTLVAAVPLMAASLTTDPVLVSWATAVACIPALAIGVVTGALVDRWSRRRVMIFADLGRAGVIGVFALLATTGHATIWWLLATVLLLGIGTCFFDPAAQAMLVRLAGSTTADLAKANGRFWSINTAGRSLLGPPVGSALFALRTGLPFGVDAVSFLLSALASWRLPGDEPPAAPAAPPTGGLWRAAREGAVFAWRHPLVRTAIGAGGLYNLGFNIAFATFVLYAHAVMHISDLWFGVMLALGALAGIVGGQVGQRVLSRVRAAVLLPGAVALQAGGWLIVVIGSGFWSAVAGFTVVDFASIALTVVSSTLVQSATPDALQGRVTSVLRFVSTGAAAVGAVIGGAAAAVAGLAAPLWVGPALLVVAATGLALVTARGALDAPRPAVRVP